MEPEHAEGLPAGLLKRMQSVFMAQPCITKVLLYGSRAKCSSKHGSDIDLAIQGHDLDLKTLNKIQRKLDELNTPYTMDCSLYDRIQNPDLLDHIQRIGIVVYQQQEGSVQIRED